MGMSNRTRDFTSATLDDILRNLEGPTEESRNFRDFWANYGECFEGDYSPNCSYIDDFISRVRYLMSEVTPAKFKEVFAHIEELDTAFAADCEETAMRYRAWGNSVDVLIEAISNSNFPASFDRVGVENRLQQYASTVNPEKAAFVTLMQEQYGFDAETARTMWKVWCQTKAIYPQEEWDWRFSRAISALQYDGLAFDGAAGIAYGDKTGYILVFNPETGMDERITAEYYFVNVLGLSANEFSKLQYNIQLQHRVCNPVDAYAVDASGIQMDPERKRAEFEKMNTMYGFDWNWEDSTDVDAFEIEWNKRYNAMLNRADFAHLQYVIAATLASELKNDSILADFFAGGDEKREAKAGWLGDAVLAEPKLSFSNDDYKADLDAENILKFMNGPPPRSLIEATQAYYTYIGDPANNANRTTVFVADASPEGSSATWSSGNTSVETVKREILDEMVGLVCTDVKAQTVVPVEQLTDEQVTQYYTQYITPERYPSTCAFVDALESGAADI